MNIKDLDQNKIKKVSAPQKKAVTAPEHTGGDLLDKSSKIAGAIFPGEKVGAAIGTLGGLGWTKLMDMIKGTDNTQFYDTSAPTPLQTVGDVAEGAALIGSLKVPLSPAKSFWGAVGKGALHTGAFSAATGAASSIQKSKENYLPTAKDLKTVAKDTAISGATGAVIGGVIGGATYGIQKAFSKTAKGIMEKDYKTTLKQKMAGKTPGADALDDGIWGTAKGQKSQIQQGINAQKAIIEPRIKADVPHMANATPAELTNNFLENSTAQASRAGRQDIVKALQSIDKTQVKDFVGLEKAAKEAVKQIPGAIDDPAVKNWLGSYKQIFGEVEKMQPVVSDTVIDDAVRSLKSKFAGAYSDDAIREAIKSQPIDEILQSPRMSLEKAYNLRVVLDKISGDTAYLQQSSLSKEALKSVSRSLSDVIKTQTGTSKEFAAWSRLIGQSKGVDKMLHAIDQRTGVGLFDLISGGFGATIGFGQGDDVKERVTNAILYGSAAVLLEKGTRSPLIHSAVAQVLNKIFKSVCVGVSCVSTKPSVITLTILSVSLISTHR